MCIVIIIIIIIINIIIVVIIVIVIVVIVIVIIPIVSFNFQAFNILNPYMLSVMYQYAPLLDLWNEEYEVNIARQIKFV